MACAKSRPLHESRKASRPTSARPPSVPPSAPPDASRRVPKERARAKPRSASGEDLPQPEEIIWFGDHPPCTATEWRKYFARLGVDFGAALDVVPPGPGAYNPDLKIRQLPKEDGDFNKDDRRRLVDHSQSPGPVYNISRSFLRQGGRIPSHPPSGPHLFPPPPVATRTRPASAPLYRTPPEKRKECQPVQKRYVDSKWSHPDRRWLDPEESLEKYVSRTLQAQELKRTKDATRRSREKTKLKTAFVVARQRAKVSAGPTDFEKRFNKALQASLIKPVDHVAKAGTSELDNTSHDYYVTHGLKVFIERETAPSSLSAREGALEDDPPATNGNAKVPDGKRQGRPVAGSPELSSSQGDHMGSGVDDEGYYTMDAEDKLMWRLRKEVVREVWSGGVKENKQWNQVFSRALNPSSSRRGDSATPGSSQRRRGKISVLFRGTPLSALSRVGSKAQESTSPSNTQPTPTGTSTIAERTGHAYVAGRSPQGSPSLPYASMSGMASLSPPLPSANPNMLSPPDRSHRSRAR
eukprot:Rmarinus@m.3762